MLAVVLGSNSVFAYGINVDTTVFRKVTEVVIPNTILVPTVVELPIDDSNIGKGQFLVSNLQNGQDTAYYFFNQAIDRTVRVRATDENNQPLVTLVDNNHSTTKLFPLIEEGEVVTVIYLSADTPVASSHITLSLDSNVSLPTSVKITALDTDIGPQVVKAPTNTLGAHTRFVYPQTVAQNWKVELTHSQPLRLTEVTLGQDIEVQSTQSFIRFLAEPNTVYQIYSNSDSWVNQLQPEAGNLRDSVGVVKIAAPLSSANPYFMESDADRDGVKDTLDNCVNISNPDQVDLNQNGVGDACDDFDKDGVINSLDNCIDKPNRNQADEDGDSVGDACDGEESRLTEKYAWIPWLGLVAAGAAILGMFLMVYRRTEEEVVETEKTEVE